MKGELPYLMIKTEKQPCGNNFLEVMQNYYESTKNLILKSFQFCSIKQETNESFVAFCIGVEKEAKYCNFKCRSIDCTFEIVAVKD